VALVGRAASEFRDRAAERVVGTEVNCQARIVVGRVEVVEDDMVVGVWYGRLGGKMLRRELGLLDSLRNESSNVACYGFSSVPDVEYVVTGCEAWSGNGRKVTL